MRWPTPRTTRGWRRRSTTTSGAPSPLRTGRSWPSRSPPRPPETPTTTPGCTPRARSMPASPGTTRVFYGTSGIEYEYNQYLQTHAQAPQNFSQLLFDKPPSEPDNVTLTVDPVLQAAATKALTTAPLSNQGWVGRRAQPDHRGRAGPGLQSDLRPQWDLESRRCDRSDGPRHRLQCRTRNNSTAWSRWPPRRVSLPVRPSR